MRRAIITVNGKVQKVRYRSKVKGIADGLGIVGEVEKRRSFPARCTRLPSGWMMRRMYWKNLLVPLFKGMRK
ncbi:MAG: acylphosphatase [Proteobacteria bacterium]|nr:acylphosphatase [Pseudomonadota bacterium]